MEKSFEMSFVGNRLVMKHRPDVWQMVEAVKADTDPEKPTVTVAGVSVEEIEAAELDCTNVLRGESTRVRQYLATGDASVMKLSDGRDLREPFVRYAALVEKFEEEFNARP